MTVSWDLLIIVVFVVMSAMGAMLGRGKVLNVLVGSFVGYVIATELGKLAFEFSSNFSYTESASLFFVKAFIFFATIIVINSKTELASKADDSGSTIISVIYGVLASGFMVTAILSFMTEDEKANLIAHSNLISMINDFRTLWIVAPLVVLIATSFIKNKMA